MLDEDIAEIQDIAQVRYLKGLFEFELGSCTVSNAKGNLKRNVHFWETNGAPGFILNLIQQGYILPLERLPTPASFKNNKSAHFYPQFVEEVINEWL